MITERDDLLPEEVSESLRRVDLFKALPDDEFQALLGVLKGIKAGPGDRLFDEGDRDDKFFVVTAGAVEIVKAIPGGGEEKLAVRRAGDVFGEMALLNDAPRSATAKATGDCECLTLSRGDFERLMGGDSLALRLLRMLSQTLRALSTRFVNVERGEADPRDSVGEGGRSVRFERRARRVKVDGFDVAGGSAPNWAGIELSAWEALRFSDGRLGLMALALQGERVPPLHQVTIAGALFREFTLAGEPPETLFARVGDSLHRNQVPSGVQFVEVGMLVPQGDQVLWYNAGGLQCALLRTDGTSDEFLDHGPPLGLGAGSRPAVTKIPIDSGDMILVLSGGSRGIFRGAVEALTGLQIGTAREVVKRVQQAIRGTKESYPDNATVLFLRRH